MRDAQTHSVSPATAHMMFILQSQTQNERTVALSQKPLCCLLFANSGCQSLPLSQAWFTVKDKNKAKHHSWPISTPHISTPSPLSSVSVSTKRVLTFIGGSIVDCQKTIDLLHECLNILVCNCTIKQMTLINNNSVAPDFYCSLISLKCMPDCVTYTAIGLGLFSIAILSKNASK